MSWPRSIVMGVDFTPCSAAALTQAVRIAERARATLHAVHVIETLVVADLAEALGPFQDDVRAGLLRDAREAWRGFTAGIPGASGLELEVEIDNLSGTRAGHHRVRPADRWRPCRPRHPRPDEPARPPDRQHGGARPPGCGVLDPGREAGGDRGLAVTARRGGH